MKKLAIIALAAVAGGASAQLYTNGAVTDGTNGGQNISSLVQPGSSFGPSCSGAINARLADDFTVTGPGWRVTAVSFYAYSTNASTFTYTRARFSIVTGGNPNSGTVVTNNDTNTAGQGTITNGGIAGYRVLEGFEDDRTRAIYKVTITNLNVLLNPGQHMIRWMLNSTNSNGPFTPPVVPFNYTNGNAWQALTTNPGGAYLPVYDPGFIDPDATPPNLDGRRFELPFQVHGEVVPEPGTMIALGAGIAAIAARRRRK